MEGKEPVATREEYSKYITRYTEVPPIELAPGINARIISHDKITISLASAEPNSQLSPHRHENEQMLIVLDGAIDSEGRADREEHLPHADDPRPSRVLRVCGR